MNYPGNIKKKKTAKPVNYANRGMNLEALINESNNYYSEKDIALINKKPTPIGISKAIYTEKGRVIKGGFFKAPSTLDYNGVYKGKYVEFEAKETQNKTAFPLANFHEHQLTYLKRVLRHQGICFVIIKMNEKIFLLKGEDLVSFLNTFERKSIPYSYLEKYGKIIKEGLWPPLDYLKIIDEVYIKGECF